MKNRNIIITLALIAFIMLIGVSFSFFTYVRASETNNQLLAGEVYMHYNETGDSITLTNAFPETDDEARARSDNYITFTIDGVNATRDRDIYYEIMLVDGSEQSGKTRLKDKDLKFDLIESSIIGGVQTTNTVLSGVSYEEINNTKIWVNTIPANTTSEVVYTYQLRMWISDEVVISDTLEDTNYTTSEFTNSYASVKVVVTGDFNKKEADDYIVNLYGKSLYNQIETSLASYLLADDGDARILSGSNTQLSNNYVWYSGKLWRIVALNNDGSIKLVTESNMTTIARGSDITYEGSWMYQWLNEDFKDTLYNYENLLVTDYSWKISHNNMGTMETSIVTGVVGALSPYEYNQSYSSLGTDSSAYANGYLNNNNCWWTTESLSIFGYFVTYISSDGSNASVMPSSSSYGIRPAINLKSTVKINCHECDGTKDRPYTIMDDITTSAVKDKLNTRISGEYVNFDNQLYRIVGVDNNRTKIVKVDYIRNEKEEILKKYFSSTVYYGAENNELDDGYWDYYLNNTWYNNISTNYKNMIVSGTWYLGIVGGSYKNTICATVNTTETTKECVKKTTIYNGNIGLGRIGEMFTSQIENEVGTIDSIFSITPVVSSNTHIYVITRVGSAVDYDGTTEQYAARPSMFLSSDVYITSGQGTKESPFEISA